MMLIEHIEKAIRGGCPFMRETCSLAYLGGCHVVNFWRLDHRACDTSTEYVAPISTQKQKQVMDRGRRSGTITAMRRRAARLIG
jgi:hypothetical protein